MSLCMEAVESACLEAGGALCLKFIENFIENCIDAGLLHTNYRELTVNYHLIVSFWAALSAKIFCFHVLNTWQKVL